MQRISLKLLKLVVLSMLMSVTAAHGADRPNFVWLLSEDNSIYHMSLYDAHGAPTPRIEEMARHGLIFEHAFCNAPVCSVARTTLITGCCAPRVLTQYHRHSVPAPLPTGLRMFPSYLRQAGYYTTNDQKKDYNAIEGEGVWDESSRNATWRNRRPGQPFFHQQNFGVTHESSLHFTEEQMRGQPTATDPANVFVPPQHPTTPLFRYTYARYHDRIQQMDAQIGEVLDRLAADGLLEDTFIFYFGDNGGVLPGTKGYAWEGGLHVPLVIRVPEKWQHLVPWDRGDRVAAFVSFIDFGPTLLNLASLEVPAQVDGKPFLGPGVSREQMAQRDEALGYADRFDEKYDLVRTLRKGRFEYVRSYQPFNFHALQNNYRYIMLAYRQWRELYQKGQLNEVQAAFFEARPAELLYDVATDPYETHNLAADPRYADVLKDMRARLRARVIGMPDLSFYPESYLVQAAIEGPVAFGQARQRQIAELVKIADLSLLDFEQARNDLEHALSSEEPWQRYWGAIVCSCFGPAAEPLTARLQQLAANDPEPLVRVRAAEFLGLTAQADPRPAIMAALAASESSVQANLILNSVVLLRDGPPGYDFTVTSESLHPRTRDDQEVSRRLEYLGAAGGGVGRP